MSDYIRYTDTELVSLLRNGDDGSFTEIYERYWAMLFSHAYKILQDDAECQDILQEVFIILWKKAPALHPDTCLAAYLNTLVRNKVLKVLSHEKIKTRYLESFNQFSGDNHSAADQELLRKDLLRLVEEEVAKMPERMREVYHLSRNQLLSHAEISQKMNISENTVKRQLNKVLSRLRIYFR